VKGHRIKRHAVDALNARYLLSLIYFISLFREMEARFPRRSPFTSSPPRDNNNELLRDGAVIGDKVIRDKFAGFRGEPSRDAPILLRSSRLLVRKSTAV